MKKNKAYTWGAWALCILVIVRFLLMLFLYFKTRNIPGYKYKIPAITIFSPPEIVIMAIVLIEAFVYWYLRYKIQARSLVRLHVWGLIFAMFFIPVIVMFLITLIPRYLNNEAFASLMISVSKVRFCLGWALTLIGHGAFIFVTVKSFNIKSSPATLQQPGDILDEFTSDY